MSSQLGHTESTPTCTYMQTGRIECGRPATWKDNRGLDICSIHAGVLKRFGMPCTRMERRK